MEKILNFIHGKFEEPIAGSFFPLEDPSRGEVFAHCADSDEKDADVAVKSAKQAFVSWSKASVSERSEVMFTIADLIESNSDELARLESQDNGKPVWLCKKVDIPRAAENFRFFAKAISQFSNESFDMGDSGLNYTLKVPLGPVVCISPWNLPLYLFTWKIAPALATGNTVIAKPSEVTPASAYFFAKLCKEAGLPDGVLNICHGHGAKIGDALIRHPDVRAVSFTGGTATGKHISRVCAERLIPCSLELGGKNPAVVFEDCDFDYTVKQLVRASFTNQGQICLCASRILIEESIYGSFKEKFISEVQKLKVGSPIEDDSDMGAIVSKQHYKKIKGYIELALSEGGVLLTGGKEAILADSQQKDFSKGYFLEPTVFEGLSNKSRTNQEEIFGPVVTLQPFSGRSEALHLANDTPYGLSATVWTQNLETAHYVSREIEAGVIWVNTWLQRDLRTPFGGMKQSGLGREGGVEALKFFTEPKNICVNFNKS
jgi:aminomuconate-semialdehyde/2-hydroxymuconate-6-semialdehyde dehydrogenase